jgi:hypothetical protein
MVTEKLDHSSCERRAYIAYRKLIMDKLNRYVALPRAGSRAGKGEGVKSRLTMPDGQIKVELITKVFKKLLAADLVENNIIASKDEMLDAIGRPSIVAVPSKANRGKKYRKIMEDLINSYLTKEKWEVIDLQGSLDLDKMVAAIGEVAGAEEDEIANIALAAGADVYVVFEANPEKGQGGDVAWSVGISAYETTTKRKLASQVSLSSRRYTDVAGEARKGMMEGLSDAMAQVLPQITDYWKEDSAKGGKFRVMFKNTPKRTDMKMQRVLKTVCSRVKLVRSTPLSADFYVQCKVDNLELAGAIDEGIESKMSGADYEFAAKNRNNIIVVFN